MREAMVSALGDLSRVRNAPAREARKHSFFRTLPGETLAQRRASDMGSSKKSAVVWLTNPRRGRSRSAPVDQSARAGEAGLRY